jgi:lipopolysaccharide transport system permease protein
LDVSRAALFPGLARRQGPLQTNRHRRFLAIVQPPLTMLVATLFFGRLAKLPAQGLPYSFFCFAAVVSWAYFSTTLVAATNVMVENQRVITEVYFPRLILPISAALS